jgi:hypothetical protein
MRKHRTKKRIIVIKKFSALGQPRSGVDKDGNVWTKGAYGDKWRKRKLNCNNKGYPIVGLWIEGKRKYFLLSRLVLTMFVGPCPEGMECCHEDGNPKNNKVGNLRWDTHKNNHKDMERHGRNRRGEDRSSSKLTTNEVLEIRHLYATGKFTQRQLADKFGMSSQMTVSKIVRRETWIHV